MPLEENRQDGGAFVLKKGDRGKSDYGELEIYVGDTVAQSG